MRGRLVLVAVALALPLRMLANYIHGQGAPSSATPPEAFLALILVVGLIGSWIVAPICEEWVYRGYLLPNAPS